MKNKTRKIAGLALCAALALTAGAAVAVVAQDDFDANVAVAETVAQKDLSQSLTKGNWDHRGEFNGLYMYRFWIGDNTWDKVSITTGSDYETTLMQTIKVNGKTLTEWKNAYKAGETPAITWEGEITDPADPNYKDPAANNVGYSKGMLDRIFALTHNGENYAPIDVTLCNHGTAGCSIDIYVPVSMVPEVTSIEFTTDFEYQGYTFAQNVKFFENSFGVGSYVGETTLEVEATTITKVVHTDINSGALYFYLGNHDYPVEADNYVLTTQKPGFNEFLKRINYYDYIEIDGKKLGSLLNGFQGETFINVWGGKDSYAIRWPGSWTEADRAAVKEIKILKGAQFPSYENTFGKVYEVQEDITFTRQESGAFADPSTLIGADAVSINWATTYAGANDVYKVDITCDDWTYDIGGNGDIYHWNYFTAGGAVCRDNILINGVSIYDINTTVDDSAYNYVSFPFNASDLKQTSSKDGKDYDVFKNPVLFEVKGNVLSLLIQKTYVNSICKDFGDELVITIKKEICNGGFVSGKVLKEDVKAVAYGIGYDVVLMNGNTKVDTMSVLGGFALNSLPTITEDHKTFAGWVDADGNPAPAVMPNESITLYAKWNITPYTLTINYLDGSNKTFTFGVDYDAENGIEYTTADLADVLAANLPEATEEIGYAYVEKVPSAFAPVDYVFTVTTAKVVFTITFVGENGEDIGVAPITFTAKTIDDLQLPAVPEKAGYKGAWDKTVDRLLLEDTTLTAVYTEIKDQPTTPDTPDTPDTPETPDSSTDNGDSAVETPNGGMLAGCTAAVGGVASGLVALGVAVVALLKKKED